MKIIISPAKKMNVDPETLAYRGVPVFLKETEKLKEKIKSLSYPEAKALWKCNDKLAKLNYQRFQEMDLTRNLTPAIMSYEGLQYQHIAPGVLTEQALEYVERHLRILSGFYGLLSPFDGVVPYRLEMQARLSADGKRNLYEFWGDKLYQELADEDHLILNLASKEYSAAVEPYLGPQDRLVTIEFGELIQGKLKQKGTFAKMARGEMVRFLAENQIEDTEKIKDFQMLGLSYCEELSNEKKLCFITGSDEEEAACHGQIFTCLV